MDLLALHFVPKGAVADMGLWCMCGFSVLGVSLFALFGYPLSQCYLIAPTTLLYILCVAWL